MVLQMTEKRDEHIGATPGDYFAEELSFVIQILRETGLAVPFLLIRSLQSVLLCHVKKCRGHDLDVNKTKFPWNLNKGKYPFSF